MEEYADEKGFGKTPGPFLVGNAENRYVKITDFYTIHIIEKI